MNRTSFAILIVLVCALTVEAQISGPPSPAELREICERGRRVAEYEIAAKGAFDAIAAAKGVPGSFARYVGKNIDGRFLFAFGRLNDKHDRFLITFEAHQGANPKEFTLRKFDQPKDDAGYFLSGARAIETALADLKVSAGAYNAAVLPAMSNQFYVYLIPAPTRSGIYPLGGDARYIVSQDGSRVIEKRQLHSSTVESVNTPAGTGSAACYHNSESDDIPEDTDVSHVLNRRPLVPEWIVAKRFVYVVNANGTINYVMTTEEFQKIKK